MATTSTAPFPYKSAITDRLEAERNYSNGCMEYSHGRSLPPIDDETFGTWRMLEPLLAGIQVLAHEKGFDAAYSTIARLEFFWSVEDDDEYRGVAIFDSRGQLVVHVLHALLGYGGSGPTLSRQIMGLLGVSIEMLDDIQRAVWNQRPYKIVVSREKHDTIEGVDTPYPTLDVEPQWEWWRVR